MVDGQDVDLAASIVDAVDDPVIPSVGAAQTLQVEPERSTDPVWVVGESAVDELDCGGCHLVRQTA